MHKRHITIFPIILMLLLPTAGSAATISLQATPASVGIGDTVRVDISLESAIPLNAFSGTLSYAEALLEPIAISDGGSIVNLWITRPALSAEPGMIPFAGITPGGYSGTAGHIFFVLFRAKVSGTANVSLEDIEMLRNDGAGGEEQTAIRGLTLRIHAEPLGGYAEPVDTIPPESFTALLGSDLQVSGERQYLSFIAADKGSGVDHYAVAETRVPAFLFFLFPPSWRVIAESPYILSDQNLISTVYIKAVDRSGNERISVFPRQHLFTAYEIIAFPAILILIILFLRKGRRRTRKDL